VAQWMLFTASIRMIVGAIILTAAYDQFEPSTPLSAVAFLGFGAQLMILGWHALAIRQGR
jgi:hypothetical protein